MVAKTFREQFESTAPELYKAYFVTPEQFIVSIIIWLNEFGVWVACQNDITNDPIAMSHTKKGIFSMAKKYVDTKEFKPIKFKR